MEEDFNDPFALFDEDDLPNTSVVKEDTFIPGNGSTNVTRWMEDKPCAHPWSEKVAVANRHVFGNDSFRPMQRV